MSSLTSEVSSEVIVSYNDISYAHQQWRRRRTMSHPRTCMAKVYVVHRNMHIAILHSEHWVYVIVGIYVIVIELRFDNRILL